jgi:predicted metal-dependent peptidase
MRFSQIIGEIDPKIVAAAEQKLTSVFLEFGAPIENTMIGTGLGGDPLVFALIVPAVHIATNKIPTAGTNGRAFYWSPEFLASKSQLGIRLTCYHESMHAIYMHPQRIGRRNLQLWNTCVDFFVHKLLFQDLIIRKKREFKSKHSRISDEMLTKKAEEAAHQLFVAGLGNYATLAQCIEMFKNPNAKIAGMENWVPNKSSPNHFKFFYADPHLPEHIQRPEQLYDLLFPYLSNCPECGRLGAAPARKQAGAGAETNQAGSSSGDGQEQPGKSSSSGQCGTCGGGGNVLDFGELLDEHMPTIEEPEEMNRRISNAIETAKMMQAGNIPASLISELGALSAPRISWQDFIRAKITKARAGNGRNDWSKFKTRPMAMGLMIPRKKNNIATAICLLDTSSSMGKDGMALGISQLQSLDDRVEITIVSCDATVYWDKAIKLRNCKAEELVKIKPVGSGGTLLHTFFRDYEKRLGKADLLIIITDGGLSPKDIELMRNPKAETVWLMTTSVDFKAPFGRVFHIDN